MSADVADRLIAVAAEVFAMEPQALDLASGNRTVAAWDSLGHVTLVEAVEEAFEVAFSAEEIVGFERLGDIRSALARHLAER